VKCRCSHARGWARICRATVLVYSIEFGITYEVHAQAVSRDVELGHYFTIVQSYRAGRIDEAKRLVAAYDPDQLTVLLRQLRQMRSALHKNDPVPTASGWTLTSIAGAALLHVEIALTTSNESGEAHLLMSRKLIDILEDARSVSTSVRLKLSLAVEYQLHRRWRLFEAAAYVKELKKTFPRAPELLLAEGLVHEAFASTKIHSARRDERLPSVEQTMRNAARSYSQALEMDSRLEEARVRLGHVLAGLGNSTEALAQLTEVRNSGSEPHLLYLAALFTAAAHQQERRSAQAVREFYEALRLYPEAYAPRMGLVHEFQARGDTDRARQLVDSVLAKDLAATQEQTDPWRTYDFGQFWRIDRVIESLRRELKR